MRGGKGGGRRAGRKEEAHKWGLQRGPRDWREGVGKEGRRTQTERAGEKPGLAFPPLGPEGFRGERQETPRGATGLGEGGAGGEPGWAEAWGGCPPSRGSSDPYHSRKQELRGHDWPQAAQTLVWHSDLTFHRWPTVSGVHWPRSWGRPEAPGRNLLCLFLPFQLPPQGLPGQLRAPVSPPKGAGELVTLRRGSGEGRGCWEGRGSEGAPGAEVGVGQKPRQGVGERSMGKMYWGK